MNFIKEKREKAGMTQRGLAKALGVGVATVCRWETGSIESVKSTMIAKIADVLHCNPMELIGLPVKRSVRMIPVYAKIACGSPTWVDEADAVDSVAVSPETDDDIVAVKAKGTSMEPLIMDGDVILIRLQPAVENGEIAAVRIGGSCTVKKVKFTEHGMNLIPVNDTWNPIELDAEQIEEYPVRIVGKVIEIRRKL